MGSEKWGPGRFEFLDAIRTHINIKLKMGIQTVRVDTMYPGEEDIHNAFNKVKETQVSRA